MKKEDCSGRVIGLIGMYSNVNKEKISVDTPISLLGLDSLGLVNLIMEIQDEFDISINISEYQFPPSFSVKDMVSIIEQLRERDFKNESLQGSFQQSNLQEKGLQYER